LQKIKIKPALFFLLFSGLLFFHACKSSSVLTGFDISSLYSSQSELTLHSTSLFNFNDSISSIDILLPAGLSSKVLSAKQKSENGTLKYEVLSVNKNPKLVDSATFKIIDTINQLDAIQHTWNFKAPIGQDYYIKYTYSFPGIKEEFIGLQYLNKENEVDASWFRFQTEEGSFLRSNYLTYAHPIRLVSQNPRSGFVIVKVFSQAFDLPLPPFIEEYRKRFANIPDSIFTIQFNQGVSEYFTPSKVGFYFFQSDSSRFFGPTLYRMDAEFPKVNTYRTMLESLRYITSNSDFRKLKSYPNSKFAIDSFWVASSGRPDLATELIRKYYGRVVNANEFFSSYTSGWKTDRGMIFIVFGKPTQVFRSIKQEIWVYGEMNDPQAIRFYFDKAENPFTNNDFVLNRHEYYKTMWYQNVQLWRR